MGDEPRNYNGLNERCRDGHSLRQSRNKARGRLSVTGNPTERPGITGVIAGLKLRTLGFFIGPVYVGETVGMLMPWVAIVHVQKGSLGEGEQEARGNSKIECVPHWPIL